LSVESASPGCLVVGSRPFRHDASLKKEAGRAEFRGLRGDSDPFFVFVRTTI
jgi:hypothetical protein